MKTLCTALIGIAVISAPAFAQNANEKAQQPKATEQQQSQVSQKQENASTTGLWQGSKLIGLNVYNDKNEKIGDIKQLMVDKSGKIADVVVGVGGFLGMGERDVAVKFSEIKWSDQPIRNTTSSNNQRPMGSTTGSNSTAASSSQSNAKKTYPDHAVWNVDKKEVESMPQFNYNK